MSDEDRAVLVDVGLAIRSAREAAGLTQQALAASSQLQRSYVAGVEIGSRNVSVLNLARIARALGLDVGELLVRR
jgi:transcriptional regulator with XRE-family HTH domain